MTFNRSIVILAAAGAMLLQGCGPADDVEVQALPPLDRGSEEARLGLAEVEGVWRLAGWELATDDTAGMAAALPDYGALVLQDQERDSIAGYYVAGELTAPVAGEVRRDGVVALVTFLPGNDGRYLVGAVAGDTIWVEMSSLPGQDSWRTDSRAAFVRSEHALDPFRRRKGVPALALAADSSAAAGLDSGPAATSSSTVGAGSTPPPTSGSAERSEASGTRPIAPASHGAPTPSPSPSPASAPPTGASSATLQRPALPSAEGPDTDAEASSATPPPLPAGPRPDTTSAPIDSGPTGEGQSAVPDPNDAGDDPMGAAASRP